MDGEGEHDERVQRGAEVEDEMEDAGHCREDGRDKKREGVDVAGEAVRAPVDAACVSGVRTMGRGGAGTYKAEVRERTIILRINWIPRVGRMIFGDHRGSRAIVGMYY